MNILNIFSYKLESFLSIRPRPEDLGEIFYAEDEKSLFLVSSKKNNGSTFYLTRWHDLFSIKKLERVMLKKGFTEPDCYAITLALSRLGYLFQIDNRQRTNKDYFIFFYVMQLVTLKQHPAHSNDAIKNHMLRFLLFELSMDHEAYTKFRIKDNILIFSTDNIGDIVFSTIIEAIYEALAIETKKEHALFSTIKKYQLSVVHFLTTPDDQNYRLDINDCNCELAHPDLFLDTLTHNTKKVFNAIADTVDKRQSTDNLFVSNMILMNYSFYVLKDNPGAILQLKKHVKDNELFAAILRAIINRKMCIKKEQFENLGIGHDLASMEEDHSLFYNIIYRQ